MGNKFTRYILIAMALGIVVGTLIYEYLPENRAEISSSINLIAMLFLRLIKMIIAPLVFATLVGGIAHMGSGSKLGRIFAKTMGWFVTASFVSLMLGLVMVNLLQPGANFPGTLPDKGQSTGLPVSAFSLEKFLTHLIPTSIADAMAQNEILQIVIFAVFFAIALGALPERAKPMLGLIAAAGFVLGASLFAGDLAARFFAERGLFPRAAPTGGILLMLSWLLLAIAAMWPHKG